MKLFDYEGGFMKTATILSRLTLLNLLWLACCIPLVTVGAATAAQHHSAACLMNGDIHTAGISGQAEALLEEGHGRLALFRCARHSLRHGLLHAELLGHAVRARPYDHSRIAFLTLVLVLMWVYPVMVNFSGKLTEITFNAFIFAFMYAPVTLIAAVFYGIAGFLFIRFSQPGCWSSSSARPSSCTARWCCLRRCSRNIRKKDHRKRDCRPAVPSYILGSVEFKRHFEIPVLSGCILERLLPLLDLEHTGHNPVCLQVALHHVLDHKGICVGA